MASGSTPNTVEIPEWTDLRDIIDNNPSFKYDHALKDDINDLIVRVRQSNEFIYFTRIKKDTADYNDYMDNYAGSVARGTDSAISVTATFSDSFNLDAFARLRTGDPQSLFDSTQVFNDQPLFWESITTGGGIATYQNDESSTRLMCTTSIGDKVIRQTKEYFNYQPGKSLRLAMTGIMGAAKNGVRQRLGYFDDNNGVFFEQTSTGIYVVIRSDTSGSPVDTRVEQSNWNIDTLDGNGLSGVNIDLSKGNIYILDIQWLGMGRLRAGFSVDGAFIYAHQFLHANNIDKVYMRTANLPLRYEIENTGTPVSSTYMDHVCVEIESEGGYNPKGVTRIASTNDVSRTVGSTYVPIIAIRLKSDYNRAQILPISFKAYNSSNTLVQVKLIHGATLTDASWVSVSDESIAEYDISATAYSGGQEIDDMFVSSQGADRNQLETSVPEMLLKIVSDYAGTSDILVLVGKSFGTTSNMYGTLLFREVY